MVYGSDPFGIVQRKRVDYAMRVVLHYRVNGMVRDWVCAYERLDHIMEVCFEKGFEIVGIEELS